MIKILFTTAILLLCTNSCYSQSDWVAYNPNIVPQQVSTNTNINIINYQQIPHHYYYNYPINNPYVPYVTYQPIYQSYYLYYRPSVVYHPTIIWLNGYYYK